MKEKVINAKAKTLKRVSKGEEEINSIFLNNSENQISNRIKMYLFLWSDIGQYGLCGNIASEYFVLFALFFYIYILLF